MRTKQQKEALVYFKKYSKAWGKKANIESPGQVNVIKQRNDYVFNVIEKREKTENVLDVGCGTGDLVCAIAKRGINAIGVDFVKEMIEIAENKSKKFKCKLAKFKHCSIFDFDFEVNKYDVISANGFIEYISFEELNKFLSLSFKGLKKGGSLVLGSRNRLFNIFSLNKFTQDEIKNNNINLLLLEAIALVNTENLRNLTKLETAPLQISNQEQLNTGINVSIRYQYTPVQLIKILQNKGFEPVQIFPIHIHGVIPEFKEKYPSIHGNMSNLLQNYAEENMSLIPHSSSFMIHVKKV